MRTYTGEPIAVKGTLPVKVGYGSQFYNLNVYVVHGKGPSLLGRNWLKHIRLDWKEIQMVHPKASEELVGMLKDYESVFSTELVPSSHLRLNLHLNRGLHPSFVGRVVCLCFEVDFETKLDRLEKLGIVERVSIQIGLCHGTCCQGGW